MSLASPCKVEMNTADQEKKSVPKRCMFTSCKRKLDVIPFTCRCGGFFCSQHRLAEAHVCQHNYFKDHQDVLLKTMSSPVQAVKVDKI